MDLRLTEPVDCDPTRIGQLAPSLLANALTHGAADRPVRLSATTADSLFTLSGSNQGAAIPPAALDRLFLPLRGRRCARISRAWVEPLHRLRDRPCHGGVLEAASTATETRFTFTMALH